MRAQSVRVERAREVCRYCEHSESILLAGPRLGPRNHQVLTSRIALRCLRSRGATVLHDDSCGKFGRAPGSDDDI